MRSTAETAVVELRDYPAALRFALRADEAAGGKSPAALGFLAEASALNKNYRQAAEAAKRGLVFAQNPRPGEPSQLRHWLEDQLTEYQSKAR